VIGHEVDDVLQAGLAHRVGEPGIGLGPAGLRIQLVVVGDVVAVGAAGFGGEGRRAVDGTQSEALQVGNDLLRRAEREGGMDLQPVGADRHEAGPTCPAEAIV